MTTISLGVPLLATALLLCLTAALQAQDSTPASGTPAGVHAFTVTDIQGESVNLADYRGKALLIVNTASKCGYTRQYEGLQTLYEKYKDQGLVVIGFPSNDFKGQEPGSDEEIAAFCKANYGVTFPMMSKVHVTGEDKLPLYRHLTEEATAGPHAGEVGWNFTKFLIAPDGAIAARFESKVEPESDQLVQAVEAQLARVQPTPTPTP